MELQKRIRAFLNDTGAPVTVFCKKVGISPTYYYKFMSGETEYSSALKKHIEAYLDEVYAK